MEQQKRRDAIPIPKFWPVISKDEFFKSVSVDRNDRFGLLFFILNSLLHSRLCLFLLLLLSRKIILVGILPNLCN